MFEQGICRSKPTRLLSEKKTVSLLESHSVSILPVRTDTLSLILLAELSVQAASGRNAPSVCQNLPRVLVIRRESRRVSTLGNLTVEDLLESVDALARGIESVLT